MNVVVSPVGAIEAVGLTVVISLIAIGVNGIGVAVVVSLLDATEAVGVIVAVSLVDTS